LIGNPATHKASTNHPTLTGLPASNELEVPYPQSVPTRTDSNKGKPHLSPKFH